MGMSAGHNGTVTVENERIIIIKTVLILLLKKRSQHITIISFRLILPICILKRKAFLRFK